jgi:hypothetical protein
MSCYFVAGPKYEVPVESGLGKEKGLEILSLFVNMKKADLPEQAHSIIKECKGVVICFLFVNWFPLTVI